MKKIFNFAVLWDVSSVGLEHRLDRAGVVGSNPSHPTGIFKDVFRNDHQKGGFFLRIHPHVRYQYC